MDVDRDHFCLVLPEEAWSDASTREGYDFRLGDTEQVLVVIHVAKNPMTPKDLLDSVAMLMKHRLNAIQSHPESSCRFEPPVVDELPPNLNARVIGQDLRNNVLMQFGHFGTPEKVVVVSHYDYSGKLSVEDFTERSARILATVRVK
jgi:hypothetical protein